LPGALTNALVVVRNEVFTVLIVEVNALNEEPVPSGNNVENGSI
jgi:hypothetical protein